MDDDADVLQGYESPVHHSLLKQPSWGGAPQEGAAMNMFTAFGMIFTLGLYIWIPVAVGIHLGLRSAAKYDPFCIKIWQAYWNHKNYYGT